MCMHTHTYTHTHTVTVLSLKGDQHVTRGGINYLNLSDLPSLFWHLYLFPPILLSVLFLFLCPPVSTHLFISTSAIFFFNPSSFPRWSSLPPPVDMWLLFQDVKPLLPIYLSLRPSLPPSSYSPPTECLIFDGKSL